MRPDEILVGSLSILIALAALGAAVGPWTQPYQLWAPRTIRDRFGQRAARFFYLVVSVALLVVGVLILAGIRPGFATGG